MALTVTPAIPASQIVNVIPSVLSAGGDALDLVGLMLTDDPTPPIGQVLSFADAADVTSYFGATTQMDALGSIYFLGYDGSTARPAKLLVAQYPRVAVGAYLRGGSLAGMTLGELQAITGSLTVTPDGTPATATINLSTATSFSNAGPLIGSQLHISGASQQSITASFLTGSGVVTGSIAGTTLTVSAISSGALYLGSVLTGTGGGGVAAATTITAFLTGNGGTGTYTVSPSQTVTSTTITGTFTGILNVTAVALPTSLAVGDVLTGAGVPAGTYITGLLVGAVGGTGAYSVNIKQAIGSESVAVFEPGVTYDATNHAFVVHSGTVGATSTMAYASGAASGAAFLRLTLASGAVLSQGSAAAAPGAFMDSITQTTQDWVSFMTTFEPSEADKQAFALWNNAQSNRYLYAMQDTNAVNTTSAGPSTAVAAINAAAYSGIAMIYEDPNVDTVGGELAAFLMGSIASIDFGRLHGRVTMKFRSQAGLAPQIFSASAATYLAGYGLNFYGDYTTANEAFTFFANGGITGEFDWIDSYVDEIWLNNQMQLALMVLLTNVGAIPYNTAGYTLIEQALNDPINAAVNFGAIVPGVTLSALQIAEVNSAAGKKIDTTLSSRGWYLQINDAAPQVRAARGSPPMTLWYVDGQSVQQITLASIELQ